jgi:hypothetical protein
MAGSESAGAPSADGPLTRRLRRLDPTWWWIRENFKLPSLGAIAGVLATGGVWIWHQHTDLVALEEQLKGLATADQVRELAAHVDRLGDQLGDQGDRIERLEVNWDRVTEVAEIPVRRLRTPKR